MPLVNWSTVARDLRVAHFLRLYSLQALPIVGDLVERYRSSGRTARTIGFAAAYFGLFMLMFVQALLGRPLIAL
ncbi:MAG: hypothetical protein KA746_00565 [Pyrinomonadaceae bacterium]|nr:hypothetical protein [Pyrinomonadaceae bacterium]MBP6213467.1 hypothetical protein [Pyrinomonadaceae bacterium]